MKKLVILCIAIVVLIACTSCSQQADDIAAEQEAIVTAEATAEPTPEVTEEPTAEPTPDLNSDPMNMAATILNDAHVIFEEDTASMAENVGANFGNVAIKKPSEDGKYYQFISNDDGAYMIGNINFLDMGDFRGNAQAILIKFQPENVEGLSFVMYGIGEVVLEFEDNQPYIVNVQDGYKMPYSDYNPTDLTLESDKWYYALLAFDANGDYRSLVWEDNNAEQKAYCNDNMGELHPEYKDSNWHLTISFGPNQTLNVEYYKMMDFDSFVE